MKIGILTYPLNYNYGNLLQAYALTTFMEGCGFNVEIIDKRRVRPSKKHMVISFSKKFVCFLFGKFIIRKKQQIVINDGFERFIEKVLTRKTRKIYNEEELKEIICKNKYDVILIGSDQVWRLDYIKDDIYIYFLDFASDSVRKIAYAASFGTDIWQFTPEQSEKLSFFAKRFNAISVREDSAVDLCKTYLNVDSCHVLDPTFLIKKESYLSLIRDVEAMSLSENLFQYILDESTENEKIVNKLNSFLNLPICRFSLKEIEYLGEKIDSKSPIQLWLKGIHTSNYVITDSFHGTAFAILFNKPFYVIGNKSRGLTRISSLLKMFNLESRLINPFDLNDEFLFLPTIDWLSVNQIIETKRKEAFLFVSSAMSF